MHTHSIHIGQIAFARVLTLRTLEGRNSQTSERHSRRRHVLPALLTYLRRRLRRQPQL
jgi:hypothetical protein